MRAFQKPLLIVIISIALFIGGIFYLLRGCLSRYDERFAIVPALYFENGNKAVIFSIVKFDEATSYSQKGGFTSKTVSSKYYVQANDAESGGKLADRKIRHQRDIKNYPVEIIGSANNTAWLFMGELMAFDPFTLDTKADKGILENKNSFIKNKLPGERKYYQFNPADNSISFTATDGVPFRINTTTLAITPNEEQENDAGSPELNKLEKLEKINQTRSDSLYAHKSIGAARRLAAGEINRDEYNRLTKEFYTERKLLYKERDSLNDLKRTARKKDQAFNDKKRKIETLSGKAGIYFNQAKTNMDTLGGAWYGIYTRQELEKLYDHFQYQAMYGETGRRQLFTSTIYTDKNDDLIIDKDSAIAGPAYLLDGGFLMNKRTGMPIHLEGNTPFLVIHKNQLGNEGKIQLSRLGIDGKISWSFDTQLKEWSDWIFSGTKLFVFGTDNKNLSSGRINRLWCIDLKTGVAANYDYFKD